GEIARLALHDPVKLEVVGRDDPCCRYGALAHEFRNTGSHEFAAGAVADDGVATIACIRVGGLDLAHSREDRLPGFDRADIAGQHAVARAKHAEVGDAIDHLADPYGCKHFAFPCAITGMV